MLNPQNNTTSDGPKEVTIKLQYGTFYSSLEESGKFTVFRLLSLEPKGIHYATYEEAFDKRPTQEDIENLKPTMMHIPQGIGGLAYWKNIEPTYHKDLTPEDLEGYAVYLQQGGLSPDSIIKEIQSIVNFSKEEHVYKLVKNEDGFKLVPVEQ